MRHRYAKEKLGAAVRSMATDKGDIKTRIWNAFQIFHTLSEKDFSEELQGEWNFIFNSLTTEEPSYNTNGELTDGKVQNTLKILSEDQCVQIAERISKLEIRLRHE